MNNQLCTGCKHRHETSIFVLCMHASSTYNVAEKVDQHTCTHMRQRGACGEHRSLFEAAA